MVTGSSALELPLPVGARITAVNAKFTDESGGPVEYLQFRLLRVNFADSLRTGTAAASAVSGNWTGFTTVPLFGSATLNTVRNDQAFYIRVQWPAHAGPLYFCGAQVLFAMPQVQTCGSWVSAAGSAPGDTPFARSDGAASYSAKLYRLAERDHLPGGATGGFVSFHSVARDLP